MRIIPTIVKNYKSIFKNPINDAIVKGFNKKEKEFFEKVLEGEIRNNGRAAQVLYGTVPSNPAFAKMKGNFVRKLLTIVCNVSFATSNASYRDSLIQIFKGYYTVRVLFFFSMRSTAILLAKKYLRLAIQKDVVFVAMDLARLLGGHYMGIVKDIEAGNEYFGLYYEYLDKYKNEVEAERIYNILMSRVKGISYSLELAELAELEIDKLKLMRDKGSFRFYFFYYLYLYVTNALRNDYDQNVKLANEAANYFETNQPENLNAIQMFRNIKVEALIGLGKIKEASEELEKGEDDTKNDKWLTKKEMKVRLYFASSQFDAVGPELELVFSLPLFKQSMAIVQERWWMYKYYYELTQLLLRDQEANVKRIKNNLTRLKQDKKGSNVALKIADILHKIYNEGIDYVIDSQDSLQNFIKDHLSDDFNKRAAIFIRMLKILPQKFYDTSLYQIEIQKYLTELRKNPEKITRKPSSEIIPYEKLWELIEANAKD